MIAAVEERFNWRLLLVCWAIAAAVFYLPIALHASGGLPFTDNDDLMRMVTATDLADGQGWQDRIEHRDNAPIGSLMHWSRLVDAPIAGLLVVLRPVLGNTAGNIVPLVWPPIMLLGLLAVSLGLTRRLMGPGHQLAALVLPLLSIIVLGEFSPGRVDHHNVQMILTTALVWATIEGRTRPLAAIAAGLLAATSLAIGVETLPFLVGAVLAFSLFWVNDAGAAGNARRFAIAFAVGTLAHLLIASPPGRYFTPTCDELSATYVVAAFLAAAAIGAATVAGSGLGKGRRLLLIALLGGLAVAITLALFPDCRAGPYGRMDARAFHLLLADVPEAMPLWTRFLMDPAAGIRFASASFAGIAILAWCCLASRGERRIDWLVLLLYLGLATLVMLMQVRGARLAIMPAMPAGVWLIARARSAYQRRSGVFTGAGLVASWGLFAGIAQLALPLAISALAVGGPAKASTVPDVADPAACYLPASYRELAALPAGNVLAPMAIGPAILRYTPDAVVAAGYHRNVAGAFDVDDFLNAGEGPARAIAARRELRYVVACSGLRQLTPGRASQPGSFTALNAANRHWSWLEPISDPADALQIFKVDPGR